MIIGVDIGGTKTQVSVFSEAGVIEQTIRFTTSQDYNTFLSDLREKTTSLKISPDDLCVAAVAGLLDRSAGAVKALGNLPWQDKPIAQDIAQALSVSKVIIENDSKLAGLAEARHLGDDYERTLYLTLSTGIGGALVINGDLAHDIADMEIGKMPLAHKDTVAAWESFASGRAFFEEFGLPASEVEDADIWQAYAKNVVPGVTIACAVLQVDAIVFGGGLGQYADRFTEYIAPAIQSLHPIVNKPKLLTTAHYNDESVVYGCYQHARDHLSS